MLSTTFSTIVSNATAEIQFRRAVLTLEGVKSDAIFAYQPPFNILALLVLLPLKIIISPRWFHKINVAAVRTLNAPILLLIGFIERRTLWSGVRRQKEAEQLPKPRSHSRAGLWDFSRGFSVHGDIQAVFDAEPPQGVEDEIENDDDLNLYQHISGRKMARELEANVQEEEDLKKKKVDRRDSVYPFAGLSQRVKDLLNEGSEDGEVKENVRKRLEALEKSTVRIEEMLGRLVANLDPPGSGSVSLSGGETGTLKDLDRSGTSDLDV